MTYPPHECQREREKESVCRHEGSKSLCLHFDLRAKGQPWSPVHSIAFLSLCTVWYVFWSIYPSDSSFASLWQPEGYCSGCLWDITTRGLCHLGTLVIFHWFKQVYFQYKIWTPIGFQDTDTMASAFSIVNVWWTSQIPKFQEPTRLLLHYLSYLGVWVLQHQTKSYLFFLLQFCSL